MIAFRSHEDRIISVVEEESTQLYKVSEGNGGNLFCVGLR